MRLFVSTLALALPLWAAAAPVNLVENGSFEANGLSNGQWKVFAAGIDQGPKTSQLLQGWHLDSGPGIELRRNAAGSAKDGFNFIELDSYGNSAMSQGFDSLIAGAEYELSFWFSPRAGVTADSNALAVLWNGQRVALVTGEGRGLGAHQWVQYRFELIAQKGSNTLGFAATGANDTLGGSLDQVSLSQAVPEPASLALLGGGLVLLGLRRRRV